MGLHALSNQMEKYIVDSADGWGETVTFTQASTGIAVTGLRAMCMEKRQDGLNEKAQVYEDGKAFLSVFLDVRPKRGDTMTDEAGLTWKVATMEGTNPYDIFCTSNERHSRARSGRMEK